MHHLQVTLLTSLEQLFWVLGENNTRKNQLMEKETQTNIRILNISWYAKWYYKKSNSLFSLKIKLVWYT